MARSKSYEEAPAEDPAPDPFPSRLELAPQLWRVRLEHAPTLTVQAGSAEEAWEVYKPLVGLLRSEHTPDIVEDKAD